MHMQATSMRKLIVTAAMLTLTTAALAVDPSPDYFKYFPGSPLSLGRGFIQNDLNKQFPEQCVTGTVADASPDTGALYSQVEIYLIRDYASLQEKMGFDARISVHAPTASFDADYREQRQRMEEQNSLTAVVQIASEFSPKTIDNPRLQEPYETLLKQGQIDEFVTRCGARIVIKERRGVQLSAIITLSDVSSKVRQEIDASASSSYGAAGFSASAKAAFNREFESAKRSQRVDIKFKAIGGEGSQAFEQAIQAAIRDVTSLDGIGTALSSYAKTLTKQNAGVLGSFVADMPLLNVAAKDPWIEEKQSRLARLADLFRNAKDRRDAINAVVIKTDPRWQAYSPAGLQALQKQLDSADELIARILQVHVACKRSGSDDFLMACIPSQDMRDKVAQLQAVPLIGPPSIRLALAVRTGPSADVTTMSDWTWADDRAMARLLDQPSFDIDGIDASSSPSTYSTGFFKRVSAEVTGAKQAIAGILVTSEYLEGLKLEFVADDASWKSDYTYSPYSMRSFGLAQLDGGQLDPMVPNAVWTSTGKRNFFLAMDMGVAVEPPPPPKNCNSFIGVDEACRDYLRRYSQDIGVAINLANQAWSGVDFPVALRTWITGGGAYAGKGRMILKAKDRFGGEVSFTVMSFTWDVDTALQLARVRYGWGDGSRNEVWYISRLGPVSENFPMLVNTYRWTGQASSGETGSDGWEQLVDKWHELQIKYCPSTATGNRPARITTDRHTAKAWVTGPGTFEINITLKAVAQVKYPGLFDPDFFSHDKECN